MPLLFCFLFTCTLTVPEELYKQHPVQDSESQTAIKHLKEAAVKTPESEDSTTTAMETQSLVDEEWDPPTEFANMLTKVAKLLNKSADVENLKHFLEFLSHPRTGRRYINIKLYVHCRTPQEVIEALFPQYINFMHTHLLRQILRIFGDEQSITLLKQYEDHFPRKKPLKRMCDPIADEEIETCTGTKRIKVKYDGDVNIDEMIVYAHQTPG